MSRTGEQTSHYRKGIEQEDDEDGGIHNETCLSLSSPVTFMENIPRDSSCSDAAAFVSISSAMYPEKSSSNERDTGDEIQTAGIMMRAEPSSQLLF